VAPDLDITLLRTFVAIVDTGGLTSAGRRVGRSQPAITHQIRRLEDGLGRPVFGCDRRRLTLTRDGEALLEYARAMLRLNDEVRNRFSAPDVAGHVTLGTPDLYAAYLLPEVLADFSRSFPNVEIQLRCTRSIHLHAALEREELDIALMTNQPELKGGKLSAMNLLSGWQARAASRNWQIPCHWRCCHKGVSIATLRSRRSALQVGNGQFAPFATASPDSRRLYSLVSQWRSFPAAQWLQEYVAWERVKVYRRSRQLSWCCIAKEASPRPRNNSRAISRASSQVTSLDIGRVRLRPPPSEGACPHAECPQP
jgi:DNA-binding transcriptional LysR family regulator